MRAPLLVGAALILLAGCRSPSPAPERDYSREAAYYSREPRTVIVLPARNETSAADAGQLFMSTVGQPLADRGYYVLPIEVTTAILRQEGIDAGQSWEIPPENLRKYFGADAALYVDIREWDTTYIVVASSVAVGLHYRLVDTRSGDLLWEDDLVVARSSDSGYVQGNDPLSWLIVSTVNATVTALVTGYVPLAYEANSTALGRIPPGPYHAGYADLRRAVSAWERGTGKAR